MRAWLAELQEAVENEQRSLIERVLKDAIPETAGGADPARRAEPVSEKT